MRKLRFDCRWINLVMSCVESVKFSILVNGVSMDFFNPSKGMHQGDPLSPYLFLLRVRVCWHGYQERIFIKLV